VYFELTLAWRHLVFGRGQTLLTTVAVSISVIVIVTIQSLIISVKQIIADDLLGGIPSITLRPKDPLPQADLRAGVVTRFQKEGERRTELPEGETLETQLAAMPHVQFVAAVAQGAATLTRGSQRLNVNLLGGDTERLDQLFRLKRKTVAGSWSRLKPEELAISWKLAEEAELRVGAVVSLETASGSARSYRIGAILSTSDQATVYTTLRTAQSLLGLGRSVSRVLIRVDDNDQADATAQLLTALFPYRFESWTKANGDLIGVFQAQDGLRYLVSVFALFGSGFAVASVLIISVTQKSKQIGILKSIGASDGQILRVFTLEALLIGGAGSTLGAALAWALIQLINQIPNPPSATQPFALSDKLFVIFYQPEIYASACAIAISSTLLAALLPARRAARLDPVEAIRG